MSASFLRLPDRFYPDRYLEQFIAQPNERRVVAELEGPGCIQHIWVAVRYIPMAARKMILRIYWDGEEHPSVEAPVGDFFGVCHGQTFYPINTRYLSVQDQSGYNCYFPMPFARSARFELETGPSDPVSFFIHIDWHRYRPGELTETQRFHAAWRREFPTQAFGEEYTILDAVGRGRLMGFAYGVRLYDTADRWSHGGAENIYIDGETTGGEAEPLFIRGSGGEDTFGTAYGGVLHKPETHLNAGMPYYVYEDVGLPHPVQRVGAYRFFEHDAIPFERSLHFRFGCVSNDICSTAYWYQDEPHRAFVRMPDWPKIPPATELLRGTVDLLEQTGATGDGAVRADASDGLWWLCGPFENASGEAMTRLLPTEEGSAPDPDARYDGGFGSDSPWRYARTGRPDQHLARWAQRRAVHGFVDFAHVFRPWTRGVSVMWPAAACAQTTLRVDADVDAILHIAWDDKLLLTLNDEPTRDLGTQRVFRQQHIPVRLRRGENRLRLKLSNTKGSTWGVWCFAFRAELTDGTVVVPSV